MEPERLQPIIQRMRREPLHAVAADSRSGGYGCVPPLGQEAIETLIPHRGAMLLVESIDDVDAARDTICGSLRLQNDDPMLAGHFPDDPIYPGVLLVEAMGQLGLCLLNLKDRSARPNDTHTTRKYRATRIHHASFFSAVVPGAAATLHAALIDDDGLTLIAAGQVHHRGRLCATSVLEVYVADQ
jgi:3-hydroxyacyl-[acyl-carrier-protein] dehydratase